MQRLTEEVNFLRENTVSESSKTAYIGSTLRFLNWLYENDRDLLTNEFISHVVVNKVQRFRKLVLRTKSIRKI